MKKKFWKIILFFVISTLWLYSFNSTLAADTKKSTSQSDTNKMTVIVQEKVPWANCGENLNPWKDKIPKYECTIEKWFWSVLTLMWSLIKYFTYLTALAWVLYIVINGIMYSMAWWDNSLEGDAKKHITKMIVWLIVLFLSWLILNFIAPWIYK